MKVTLTMDQSVWMQLLARAHEEEGVAPDDVVAAWMRRALRQPRTLLPRSEERPTVVGIRRRS